MDIATATLEDLTWYRSYLVEELSKDDESVDSLVRLAMSGGGSLSQLRELRAYQKRRLEAVNARIALLS